MKVTALALLPLFCATSAFGLNGAAQSVTKSTRSVGFAKSPAMVQPMDIQGNRLNTVVRMHHVDSSQRIDFWWPGCRRTLDGVLGESRFASVVSFSWSPNRAAKVDNDRFPRHLGFYERFHVSMPANGI